MALRNSDLGTTLLICSIVYLSTNKYVHMMTLTYFTAMSNLVPYAFVWEDGETMDFSETVVVYDIKVGRCSQLNEYVKLYEYQRSRRCRASFDLVPDHSDSIFVNSFLNNC